MEELLKPIIEYHNNNLVVSSRVVAEQLNKRHADLIRQIETISENEDVRSLIIPSTYQVEGQNRRYKEYLLTKDGFILYMFNIQGHNDFKMAYISKFNEMEKAIKENQIALPTTYKEALIQLVAQVEQREKLQIENATLKPKADYFDDLVDRNLLTNFRETAKELKIPEKEFINYLLDNKYIFRNRKRKLEPYAEYRKSGLFELKESKSARSNWTGLQTLITPKGRETFRLLLKK